jgi:hypothetical protein
MSVLGRLSFTLLLSACAHGSPTGPEAGAAPGEEILECGGELGDTGVPAATLIVTSDAVEAWGMIEVPDGSRLQAAHAGVDAITRAALLEVISVRVVSIAEDRDSSDPTARALRDTVATAVHGALATAPPLAHGWARLRRDGATLLRVTARLRLPRAQLRAALAPLETRLDRVDLDTFIERIAPPAPEEHPTP